MLYDKYFKSNFDELITYYPKFYREVFEMVAILKAEGKLADDLEDNIESVFNNCFIDTADEQTIGRLEQFLYINTYSNRPIEERRNLVKAYFIGNGKVSGSQIKEIVRAFTGDLPEIEFIKEYLIIRISIKGNVQFYLPDILGIIKRRLPAHLAFYFRLKCSQITHKEFLQIKKTIIKSEFCWFGSAYGIRFNGTICFDGSKEFDSRYTPYDFIVWYRTRAEWVETLSAEVSVSLLSQINESFVSKFKWKVKLLNLPETMESKAVQRNKVNNRECFTNPVVTITHNLWHFDGTVPFDGRQTFDAYQIKPANKKSSIF